MDKINLLPMAGINRVGLDEALQVRGDAPRIFLREAVNVDISPNGRPRIRDGLRNVSAAPEIIVLPTLVASTAATAVGMAVCWLCERKRRQ